MPADTVPDLLHEWFVTYVPHMMPGYAPHGGIRGTAVSIWQYPPVQGGHWRFCVPPRVRGGANRYGNADTLHEVILAAEAVLGS